MDDALVFPKLPDTFKFTVPEHELMLLSVSQIIELSNAFWGCSCHIRLEMIADDVYGPFSVAASFALQQNAPGKL